MLFRFSCFLPNILIQFTDPIQDTTLHVALSPQPPLGYGSFSDFPCFGDLDSLEDSWQIGQESCRMCLSLDLSVVFLMMGLGLCVLGRRDTEAGCLFHHTVSKLHLNMAYHYWCWPQSPGWGGVVKCLHCKGTLIPFPCCALWEEFTVCSPHLRSEELCSTTYRAEYLRELFEVLNMGDIHSPPFLIHSIICLYKYGLKDIYLYFGLWPSNSILFLQLVQFWPLGAL